MGFADDQYGFLFEGGIGSFPHFGINLRVLGPGKSAAMYHAESGLTPEALPIAFSDS